MVPKSERNTRYRHDLRNSGARTDDYTRKWTHVDPSRPDLFPAVPFEDIMRSDKGVATWTEKIVSLSLTESQRSLESLPFTTKI
jgi:hypothetical protein